MRLLVLTHRLPVPPRKGEKIRALNVIKHLAREHQIHLGALVDDPEDLRYLDDIRPWVRTCVYQRVLPRLKKAVSLGALLQGRSASVEYFYSEALQRKVDHLIEREVPEGVFCSSSPMAEYLFRSRHADVLTRLPKVMDLIDVDSAKWDDYAARSSRWRAWMLRREARLLGTYERRIAEWFDDVLVVSDAERHHFPQNPVPESVRVMGNGVDLTAFSPSYPGAAAFSAPTLVFTGVMDYRPNVDGILWFVDEILPRVRHGVPGVRLYVVGNRPTNQVRRLAKDPDVIVTGLVDDVRPYVAAADVCIAPLRIARGIQNKVLEAMAMGKPVIATRVAFEGIDAQPARDLVVVDDPAAFAAATMGLLADPLKRAEIGAHARRRMEARYSWDRQLGWLDQVFGNKADAGTGAGVAQPHG